jgi:hypothetical protein
MAAFSAGAPVIGTKGVAILVEFFNLTVTGKTVVPADPVSFFSTLMLPSPASK